MKFNLNLGARLALIRSQILTGDGEAVNTQVNKHVEEKKTRDALCSARFFFNIYFLLFRMLTSEGAESDTLGKAMLTFFQKDGTFFSSLKKKLGYLFLLWIIT